ncbi:MAG TPA: hypothetical protein DCW90_00395 [Lachnospiraceae bacterium]|mgnify:CR=1 FL=1|nr:hypothetical protein [uncultured Lachnoclostridium sp.]HAU84026.1 hypothetical protein [Lachnospiraceae bacterium]
MIQFEIERERVHINIKCIMVGEDLCVIISGGDRPHIGAAAVGYKENEYKESELREITFCGHKDDIVMRSIAKKLSYRVKGKCFAIGGIHLDHIKREEIEFILGCLNRIVERVILDYRVNFINKSRSGSL